MRDYIDAAAFKELILCADAALHGNIQKVIELNVFPVPDGDTGTNMGLTLNNAATELRKKNFVSLDAAADCVAPEEIPALSCPCCSGAFPAGSRALNLPEPWNLPAPCPTAWTRLTKRS